MVKVVNNKIPSDIFDDQLIDWCDSLVPASQEDARETWQKTVQLAREVANVKQLSTQKNLDSITKSQAKNNKEHQKACHNEHRLVCEMAVEMLAILAQLKASTSTLQAAFLYPMFEKQWFDLDFLAKKCPASIIRQLEGVSTMDAIRSLQTDLTGQNDATQIDNLRKMLLAMVDDVRVVLIKLAERLCVLRHADKLNFQEQNQLADEISDVYAPLANRLGVGQIKWEMEDLAFRLKYRDEYLKIAKNLDEKRVARETYVDQVLAQMHAALNEIGVSAELQGRAKHIYSIWKKMQRKQVGFEEIYDVRAVRVLVSEVKDCYSVLGVVHGLWKHIPKEFDDYIATPKENGYRSLHTAVIGPEGKTLEVQIRTFDMHQESELGVAAHWKYKEGSAAKTDGYETKIAWLRQLLEWQDEVTESKDLVAEFKNQVTEERVYVFTPQGKLIDLPKGSTPVDFAYRVHTDVGHRCRGAKVNGRIAPLTQSLKTGQRVEILTGKSGGPSRDWLSEHHGYVKSSRARSKIHQWFRHQDRDKNAAAGKAMLEKELVKLGLKNIDLSKVAKYFNYQKLDELYAGIGAGDKGIHQVINAIRNVEEKQPAINRTTVIKKKANLTKRSASSDILVEGVGNLLTRMAGCCKPVPGDSISGFVSQGRGIMIHREDCRYLIDAQKNAPQKVLHVEWSQAVNQNYLIDLTIKAYDRKGLLGDITSMLSEEKISVTALNTHVNKKRLLVDINIQIEVPTIAVASKIMTKIEQFSTVVSVKRK